MWSRCRSNLRFYKIFQQIGDCHAAKEQQRRLATTSLYEMYSREKRIKPIGILLPPHRIDRFNIMTERSDSPEAFIATSLIKKLAGDFPASFFIICPLISDLPCASVSLWLFPLIFHCYIQWYLPQGLSTGIRCHPPRRWKQRRE